jgi:hypothetical protein
MGGPQVNVWPQKTFCLRLNDNSYMFDFFVANICSFSGVRVTLSLVFYVCFVDRCLSFCTLSFWSLFCLFFFDIRILITSLISILENFKNLEYEIKLLQNHKYFIIYISLMPQKLELRYILLKRLITIFMDSDYLFDIYLSSNPS